ncbi:hypothetical protein NIIDMKKI_32280 [Mycobacterium kansasii]|uniref:Uncharacterized protein n=1 Tax=Mycobacterium kansasii TaxID=1768 RepID=A0A7G1IDR2_MYCKA|nr:hypothetical protein NIIDMKKI_32280 [Mycobacterium kansasii]
MRCRRTGPVIEWPRGFVALAKTAAIASSVPNMEKADRPMTRVEIAVVGVHVLDTHVLGITSIPEGSQGQLVPTIKISPPAQRAVRPSF